MTYIYAISLLSKTRTGWHGIPPPSLLGLLAVSDRPEFCNRNCHMFEESLPLPCYPRYCFSWCHCGHLLCPGNLLHGTMSSSPLLAFPSQVPGTDLRSSTHEMRRGCTLHLAQHGLHSPISGPGPASIFKTNVSLDIPESFPIYFHRRRSGWKTLVMSSD